MSDACDSAARLEPTVADRDSQVGNGQSDHASTATAVRVGLVDAFEFTRGCIAETLRKHDIGFAVEAYPTIDNLAAEGTGKFDVLLFYCHGAMPSSVLGTIRDWRKHDAIAGAPIIVLSDGMTGPDSDAVKTALRLGTHGFISTRTFDAKTLPAAISFVVAGGIFAQPKVEYTGLSDPSADTNEPTLTTETLTAREQAVLWLLQQGKANKTIAHELGMSENTARAHLRNIMRKTGALNRTQAVYHFQRLLRDKTL